MFKNIPNQSRSFGLKHTNHKWRQLQIVGIQMYVIQEYQSSDNDYTCEVVQWGCRYVTDDKIITNGCFWMIFWKETLNKTYKSVILEIIKTFILKICNFLSDRLELWVSVNGQGQIKYPYV